MQLNLDSEQGAPAVEAGGALVIQRCDVVTVSSRDVAASGPPPPEWSFRYFGSSTGIVRLEKSRLLMPAEVQTLPCVALTTCTACLRTQGFHIVHFKQYLPTAHCSSSNIYRPEYRYLQYHVLSHLCRLMICTCRLSCPWAVTELRQAALVDADGFPCNNLHSCRVCSSSGSI